ncbi:MAG: bifunctional riboflavin kinase/FAD synthetase [Lysobacterales bacterium]|jgi:riboflavin kinase/FMN adenylyltransferase
MQLIRDNPGGRLLQSSVVTIGNFDGVHLGHQALIRHCRALARNRHTLAMVTFEPLPQAWFRPEAAPARLMPARQKLECLAEAGVDLVWLMRFNQALADMEADAFTREILAGVLAAKIVVVGEDFRYGRGRQGDIESLRQAGAALGFRLETFDTHEIGGRRVSSSAVREALAAGRFDEAAELLGRPFRMQGRVSRGRSLGRQLGYPTANMPLTAGPSPVKGVFAVKARLDRGRWRDGVANLGTRPAVGGGEFMIEVHLFDFAGDLYGHRMEVEFVAKLRDEEHFARIDDLVKQMREDECQARACLARKD